MNQASVASELEYNQENAELSIGSWDGDISKTYVELGDINLP